MAQQDAAVKEAIEIIEKLFEDDKIRLQYEAHRLYVMDQKVTARMIQKAKQQMQEAGIIPKEVDRIKREIEENRRKIEKCKREIEESERELEILQAPLGEERFQELPNAGDDEEL